MAVPIRQDPNRDTSQNGFPYSDFPDELSLAVLSHLHLLDLARVAATSLSGTRLAQDWTIGRQHFSDEVGQNDVGKVPKQVQSNFSSLDAKVQSWIKVNYPKLSVKIEMMDATKPLLIPSLVMHIIIEHKRLEEKITVCRYMGMEIDFAEDLNSIGIDKFDNYKKIKELDRKLDMLRVIGKIFKEVGQPHPLRGYDSIKQWYFEKFRGSIVRSLDLSGLGLRTLPIDVLAKLRNLHELDLSNNEITSLRGEGNHNTLRKLTIAKLYINGNPLRYEEVTQKVLGNMPKLREVRVDEGMLINPKELIEHRRANYSEEIGDFVLHTNQDR